MRLGGTCFIMRRRFSRSTARAGADCLCKLLIGEVAERSKALDWNSSNTQKVFVGSNPTLSATPCPARRGRAGRAARILNRQSLSMVARVGSSATISRKPRQARKGAAVAVRSGAGGVLARAASLVSRLSGIDA